MASSTSATEGLRLIYLGPGSVRRGLHPGMVFKERVSEPVGYLAGRCPEILDLIVPVERMHEARRDLATPGTALAMAWDEVARFLEGKEGDA